MYRIASRLNKFSLFIIYFTYSFIFTPFHFVYTILVCHLIYFNKKVDQTNLNTK